MNRKTKEPAGASRSQQENSVRIVALLWVVGEEGDFRVWRYPLGTAREVVGRIENLL